MAEIHAFRGWRYDLGHIGTLSDVVAPPYDVIDPALQQHLYKRHPANVIRLELNREEPGDDPFNNRYTRAAWFFNNWRREGVLRQEADPSFYVYFQTFDVEGRRWTRRGFIGLLRLEPLGEGMVFPHEETHAAAKEDRLHLLEACQANISPIFALYPDPQQQAQPLLEELVAGRPALTAVDHLGVEHQLWPVSDVTQIARLTALLGQQPIYIADGHHRYETALNYRNRLAERGALSSLHPAQFVMTMFVSMADEGLLILPTHRLFRGLPALHSDELRQRLSDYFETRMVGEGIDLAHLVWEQMREQGTQEQLAFFTAPDERWLLARLAQRGQQAMDQLAADHCPSWRRLGVAILHRLVVETLLGAPALPTPTYVHCVDELIQAFAEDRSPSDPYTLAALVMPASVEHIQQVSQAGERMPAKSTYFYPKLLTGLVFYAHD